MPDYSVFGGVLRSEIPFPQLPATAGAPTWRLSRASSPPAAPGELLGEDRVDGALRVRLFRRPAGFRLEYDDTGAFDVDATGGEIRYYEGPAPVPEAVQLDVLGRVLPAAMHAAGVLSLHGSAVELAEGAVAFLAPKGAGKSTLAQALVRAGARLITDDVVPLEFAVGGVRMRPGLPEVRLRRDSARHLEADETLPLRAGGKVALRPSAARRSDRKSLPVAALYLLRSAPAAGARQADRGSPLSAVAAAMALLGEARLALLLGGSEAPVLLERAVRVARSVPVYALHVPRDFACLTAAARQVLGWHGGAAVEAGPR